jgi:2-C-methyl-D-erythritol 4-phosphate cytidylyltransferase
MFRYRVLLEALRGADPAAVTDEASAIERLGLKPRLVTGSARNIKVTYPEDLVLAEQILRSYEP